MVGGRAAAMPPSADTPCAGHPVYIADGCAPGAGRRSSMAALLPRETRLQPCDVVATVMDLELFAAGVGPDEL